MLFFSLESPRLLKFTHVILRAFGLQLQVPLVPVKYNAEVTGENARNYFLTAALIRCRDAVGRPSLRLPSASFKWSRHLNFEVDELIAYGLTSRRIRPGPRQHLRLAVSKGRLSPPLLTGMLLRGPLCNGDKAFKLSLYDCTWREPGFSFAINFATPPGLPAYPVSLVLFIGSTIARNVAGVSGREGLNLAVE